MKKIATGPLAKANAAVSIGAVPARSLPETTRLFADALKRADAKPTPARKKLAEDAPSGSANHAPVRPGDAMAPTVSAPAAPADPAIAAHIERIAAAIAEVASGGAHAEVHIQLPPGATRIDGAVIGRNESGGLHIVLTTASAITPASAAQLQADLNERLVRREIRVARMSLQRVDRRA